MSVLDMTALKLRKRIQSGNIAAVQVAEASLVRIEAVKSSIRAYMTVNEKKTMEQTKRVQTGIEAGRLSGPLAGIPVATKDSMCMEGIRTTCSSEILESFIPAYMAQVVTNLEQIEAVILGKTSMDESAIGSTMETSAFGAIRSLQDPKHAPRGFSDDSCVAVATGECFYTLGSNTGGSIRQPGSSCDVTGIKPAYGTVFRYGLVAYGSSLDQTGPVAKDVSDCMAVLGTLASHDPKDGTSMERSDCDFAAALSEDVRGMCIDIPESYLEQGLDQEVKDAVLEAARVLGEEGAIVETFDLKLVEYAIPVYYIVASAEASSSLSRSDGVKYGYRAPEYEGLHNMYKKNRSQGFEPEVKRRIILGSFVLSSGYCNAYYLKALRTGTLIKKEFNHALASYDVILAPAAPAAAPWLDQSLGDPLKMYLEDTYTISVNLAGLPGISLLCGLNSKGLPIGLQLIRDCFKEKSIIRAACTYEKARKWKLLPVTTGTPEEPSGVTAGEAERKMSHE